MTKAMKKAIVTALMVVSAALAQQGAQQSAQPTAPKSEVGQREANQQKRIANGVKSGELTPHETANLENKEGAIHQQIKDDRQANGGKLSAAEKQQINHEQNKVSRDIYRDKHNDLKQNNR